MESKKEIIVFGGSFNPPLNSHFSLAEQIVNEYENIEKVLFVPVNSKYEKEHLISNEARYQMLKLVCDKNEKFDVSRVEIDSPRALYTIETLSILENEYPNNIIKFATGTDNLKQIHTWEKADELTKKFKILVLERDNDDMDEIIANNKFLSENKSAFIKVKNNIKSNLSSTFVRAKIKAGKSIRYFTPDEIVDYMQNNKLYE